MPNCLRRRQSCQTDKQLAILSPCRMRVQADKGCTLQSLRGSWCLRSFLEGMGAPSRCHEDSNELPGMAVPQALVVMDTAGLQGMVRRKRGS